MHSITDTHEVYRLSAIHYTTNKSIAIGTAKLSVHDLLSRSGPQVLSAFLALNLSLASHGVVNGPSRCHVLAHLVSAKMASRVAAFGSMQIIGTTTTRS